MKEIKDILVDSYDYPKADMLTEMHTDTVYNYVNSTFCVGLLNWFENQQAYMIVRYSINDCDYRDYQNTIELDDNNELLKPFFNNIEYLDRISDKDWYHTNYGAYCIDDVIITGESDNNYYAVWLDQDVSDCCIFKINKEHYQSLDEFNEAVQKHFEHLGYKIKSIRSPQGWITW